MSSRFPTVHLFDRPYQSDPDPLRADQRAELHFDAELLAAVGSAEALVARGIDLSQAPRRDDRTIWDASSTTAALCKVLRDYEAACAVAFEHAPDDTTTAPMREVVLGPVARTLAPHADDPPAFGQGRSAYLRGDWAGCLALMDRALAADPQSARAYVLSAHALLRRGDLAGAERATTAALVRTGDARDLQLHATYLSAVIALRTGQPARVARIGTAMLGALGGGRGAVTWSLSADDLALDLAFLAVKACARLTSDGAQVPSPPVYERLRALVVRHPVVVIRLAADPGLRPIRQDIARAIHTQHEGVLRDMRTLLDRWKREISRGAAHPDDDEPARFREESALAERRGALGLLDAIDARTRLRGVVPDAIANTQRSFSDESDDAERSSSAMVPLTQSQDSGRRDNLTRAHLERAPATVAAPARAPTGGSPPSDGASSAGASSAGWVLAGALGLVAAATLAVTGLIEPPWGDTVVITLCVAGVISMTRHLGRPR